MQTDEILKFFFEMGQLSRVKREGWRMIGVEQPESVADHSLRAAQIGWVLAAMEGYDKPEEVATMVIFHDMGECRVGDLHKVAARYATVNEEDAVREQTSRLAELGKRLFTMWKAKATRSSVAGVLAKDADLIELAVRAREYMEWGHKDAVEWFNAAVKGVQTNSAKQLLAQLPTISPSSWWEILKKHS
jgi:putative hydrolase of HD superfamily